ncbi:holo-[acyl-carrier-protein] synthase [Cohnella endophytica]|uniref:Holo-[acyl-carrier-protein] synthase n=1 Tax=Cohnella endophytica TaxID=2419778 RepID=A0A494XKZ2_9BACL|nr:holo-ACP synthase [Cohnella endophytica]RKP48809.1 holo-[acyl-carrier-protein] synthase [Cohnella endophytica]
MIVGIGLDVVELARMEKLLSGAAGRRFVERVLTAREREHLSNLRPRRALEYVSGRFAAKEAVVKALGCGIGAKVGFHDIEVLPDALGKPIGVLSKASMERLGWKDQAYTLHIAITHERSLAAATALIEK